MARANRDDHGIVAKRRDLDYRSGKRDGMQKVKNFRSAECVVGGFRYRKGTKMVGSLLLGLYEGDGLLHHVGFTSSIAAADRPSLTKKLEKLIAPPGFTGTAPGGPSRWNQGKENIWHPLSPCSSSKSATIMLPAIVSAMAPSCLGGGQTKRPHNVRWISSRKSSPICCVCSDSVILQPPKRSAGIASL